MDDVLDSMVVCGEERVERSTMMQSGRMFGLCFLCGKKVTGNFHELKCFKGPT